MKYTGFRIVWHRLLPTIRPAAALLCGLLLGTMVTSVAVERNVQSLASDEKRLFEDLLDAVDVTQTLSDLFKGAKKQFKVVRINPINGNNFLNQREPLLNFNGQIIDNTVALRAAIAGNNNQIVNNNNGAGNVGGGAGGGAGGAFSGCLGTFASGPDPQGGGGLDGAVLSLNINEAAQTCNVVSNASGNIDFFFPAFLPQVVLEFSIITSPFNIDSINPPPTQLFAQFAESGFGTFTMVLNSNQNPGQKINITYTLTFVSGTIINGGLGILNPAFTITINSITLS